MKSPIELHYIAEQALVLAPQLNRLKRYCDVAAAVTVTVFDIGLITFPSSSAKDGVTLFVCGN